MVETRKQWYKRWWAIVLYVFVGIIVLSVVFGGDKSSSNATQPNNAVNTQQTTPTNTQASSAPKNFAIGDSVKAGDFTWKITAIDKETTIGANEYLTKTASGEYMIISVEVENTGNTARYLMDSFLKIVDDKNREFSADSGAAIYLGSDQALIFDTVNPGIVKKGKIVFDVPKGLQVANLRISDNLVQSSVYNVKLMS